MIANIHIGLTPWATATYYPAGARVSFSGSAYQAIHAETTSGGSPSANWVLLSAIDYVDLASWAFALPSTLTQPMVAQIWNDGPIVVAPGSGIVALAGHTTTPAFNIVIRAAPGDSWRDRNDPVRFSPSSGVAFVLPLNGSPIDWIRIDDNNVTIDGLQFQDAHLTSASSMIGAAATVTNFTISNCIFDGYAQAGGASLVSASQVVGPFICHDNLFVDRQALDDQGFALGAPGGPQLHDIARCTFISVNGNESGAAIAGNNTSDSRWGVRNCVFAGYVLPLTNSGLGVAMVDHCALQYPSYMFPSGGFTDIGGNLFSVDFSTAFVGPVKSGWPITPYDFRIPLTSPLFHRGLPDVPDTNGEPVCAWHFSPNGNFATGSYAPGIAGMNVADVSSRARLDSLPSGVLGLVFIGYQGPADAGFVAAMAPYVGATNIFGFYLADDADPTKFLEADFASQCAYIHTHFPGAITFFVPENLGNWFNPVFQYTYAGAGIDYWGLDNYAMRPGYVDAGYQVMHGENYNIINSTVNQALACGVPLSAMIPTYQAFGGSSPTSSFTTWTMPTVAQTQKQLRRWGRFCPTPGWDYTYSWGIQTFGGNPEPDDALVNHPELQAVYLTHATTPPLGDIVYQDIGCSPYPLAQPTAIVLSCAAAAVNLAANSMVALGAITLSTVATAGQAGLVTNPAPILLQPNVAKPAYLTQRLDPTFMTHVTRVGGDSGGAIPGGTFGLDVRHEFAAHQAWNATGDLLLLQNEQAGSSPSRLFLDGRTYAPLFTTPSNYPSTAIYEERWHPHQGSRNVMIMAGGTSLVHFDVRGNVLVKSWTLPIPVIYIGATHGNPSDDGKYLLLHNSDQMFIVDMDAGIIGPVVDIPKSDFYGHAYTVNWATVSPSGRFAIVHYDTQDGFVGDYDRVFDVNPATLAITVRTTLDPFRPGLTGASADGFIYRIGNSDLACNPWSNNDDVIIGSESAGNVGKSVPGVITSTSSLGHVVMVRLRDGQTTSLSDPANEARVLDVSCRNLSRPGWCFVTYVWPWPLLKQRFASEVVAVKMDTTQTIERLAHAHTDSTLDLFTHPYQSPAFDFVYRSNAHALPSQDGFRIAFASNWLADGSGGAGNVQSHVIDTQRRNLSRVSYDYGGIF